MILRVHNDTSYLSEPKARSRAGGYFFMGNKDNDTPNGAILTPPVSFKLWYPLLPKQKQRAYLPT